MLITCLRIRKIKDLVVTAESGLDEMDSASNNNILEVTPNGLRAMHYPASMSDTQEGKQGLSAKENANAFIDIISNRESPYHYFHSLIGLNSALGFLLAGKVNSIEQGRELAYKLIDSGQVLDKYTQCRSLYEQYSC